MTGASACSYCHEWNGFHSHEEHTHIQAPNFDIHPTRASRYLACGATPPAAMVWRVSHLGTEIGISTLQMVFFPEGPGICVHTDDIIFWGGRMDSCMDTYKCILCSVVATWTFRA